MANKYERKPEYILDLHGYTVREAQAMLDELFRNSQYTHIRIITGKGTHRSTGPILREFVKKYLNTRGINFSPSKIQDGGDGSLEVFLK